jgi:hypothetical protein
VKYAWGKVSAIKTQHELLNEIEKVKNDIVNLNRRLNPDSQLVNPVSQKLKDLT